MGTGKYWVRYRIPSARKPNWDYRNQAIYFVTICTNDRIHYFGNIKNGKIILSETGQIATDYWFDIPNHFPFIELLNFVAMPNHIHGLLQICDNNEIPVETLHATSLPPITNISPNTNIPPITNISPITNIPPTTNISPTSNIPPITNDVPIPKNESMAKISPKPGSLPSVIRSYKSAVTKYSNQNNIGFGWQPGYHDHVVRDNLEYNRISNYISNNPANWKTDKFNS